MTTYHTRRSLTLDQKMGAKTLAYHISTALVILLFGFAGTVKVAPAVSPDIHNEMVSILYLL